MAIRAGDHATPLSVIPAQAGTTPPVETRIAHCRRLLEHAAELIAQGDRLQASEKLWGAAAHRIKALAPPPLVARAPSVIPAPLSVIPVQAGIHAHPSPSSPIHPSPLPGGRLGGG